VRISQESVEITYDVGMPQRLQNLRFAERFPESSIASSVTIGAIVRSTEEVNGLHYSQG
jgi:hypothetical protein